jgi:PAS domain S-box-containing protein
MTRPIPHDVFERSPALLAHAGADGTLTHVNPAWAAALGRTPAELAGVAVCDLVHSDDRAAVERALGCGATGEQRFAHADGSWRVLRWRAASGEDGTGLHLAAHDVTADRGEMGAVAAAVAHDLRAPLRAVDGFSRVLLAHDGGLPDETARYLALVREAGTDLATLLDGLVRVLDVGRAPFAPQEVDPAAVATEVIDLVLRARQGERDVIWSVGALPVCRADVPLLRRLLEELLGNALTFTAPNPDAHIELTWDEAAQAYVVRDDGVGFDDANAARAFEIFGRLHPRDVFAGTGVGLPVAARIVARHGGRIWARSAPGRGAAFSFTLR